MTRSFQIILRNGFIHFHSKQFKHFILTLVYYKGFHFQLPLAPTPTLSIIQLYTVWLVCIVIQYFRFTLLWLLNILVVENCVSMYEHLYALSISLLVFLAFYGWFEDVSHVLHISIPQSSPLKVSNPCLSPTSCYLFVDVVDSFSLHNLCVLNVLNRCSVLDWSHKDVFSCFC